MEKISKFVSTLSHKLVIQKSRQKWGKTMLKELIFLSVKYVCYLGVVALAVAAGRSLRIRKNRSVEESN